MAIGQKYLDCAIDWAFEMPVLTENLPALERFLARGCSPSNFLLEHFNGRPKLLLLLTYVGSLCSLPTEKKKKTEGASSIG